jgi:hypothetical protein
LIFLRALKREGAVQDEFRLIIFFHEAVEIISWALYPEEWIPKLTRRDNWLATYNEKKYATPGIRVLNPETFAPAPESIKQACEKRGFFSEQRTEAIRWLRKRELLPPGQVSPDTFVIEAWFREAFEREFHAPPPHLSELHGGSGDVVDDAADASEVKTDDDKGNPPPGRRRLPERPVGRNGRSTSRTAAWDTIGLHKTWSVVGFSPLMPEARLGVLVTTEFNKQVARKALDPDNYDHLRFDINDQYVISGDTVGRVLVPRRVR